ncbi:MAG: type II secretion system F family protein, partial [Candidatus Omnitrophica bacterium]|nr:type II secretion system F family protein [Candidatus Omnitrophota bacterium]
MARYFYIARDATGSRKEGFLEAEGTVAAVAVLRRQNLVPVQVRVSPEKRSTSRSKVPTRGRVSLGEMALFSRQVATMLDAGIPVVETLGDLAEETPNRYFSYVLKEIQQIIKQGSNFSQALARFPRVFSDLYIALVRSGEESGNLVEVMKELSSELEDQLTLRRKVRQATSYPLVILVFFVAVVFFVFLYLVPKFQAIFSGFGAQLPALTLMILTISRVMVKFLPVFLIFFLVIVGVGLLYSRTPRGKRRLDALKLKIPIFGPLFHKVSLSRFSRSLSTLLHGGVTIISALSIVSKTAGNSIIEDCIERVRQGVLKGELLGREMKKYRVFPSMLVRMVTVGEDTGRTDEMLTRVSRFYRD